MLHNFLLRYCNSGDYKGVFMSLEQRKKIFEFWFKKFKREAHTYSKLDRLNYLSRLIQLGKEIEKDEKDEC